eukprot:14177204-Alexandrium_andersonii.AAC.1
MDCASQVGSERGMVDAHEAVRPLAAAAASDALPLVPAEQRNPPAGGLPQAVARCPPPGLRWAGPRNLPPPAWLLSPGGDPP